MLERIGLGDIKKEYIGKMGAGITIDESGITLNIALPDLEDIEIKNYREGNIKLGLLNKWGKIFIFYKFGLIQWGESIFSVNFPTYELSYAGNHKEYSYPKSVFETSEEGIALTLVLIEANTGEVKGLRLYGTPNEFSRDLVTMLNEQIETKTDIDYKQYAREYVELQERYSTLDLLKFGKIY